MRSMTTAESMVFDAFRVVAASIRQGAQFVESHLSEILEKKVTPTIQYIESNNLSGTRFYAQLLERLANLYLSSGHYDHKTVIDIMERSVRIRVSGYGNRHPSILLTVWNLFGEYMACGLQKDADKRINHLHGMLNLDGIIAYPHLHENCQSMNDIVLSLTNGKRYMIRTSSLVPDYISSRDTALGCYYGNPAFDIYKEYCTATGSKIDLVETMSVAPAFNFYSLPVNQHKAFADFAWGRPIQGNGATCKIIFLPGYFRLEGTISPFWEITVHDTENKRLLLPRMDGTRQGLSLPGTNEFEWFDYLFDDDPDLQSIY